MSYRFIKVLAAAATIAATPVLAEAQTVAYGTSSPVEIVAFGVDAQNIAWTGAGIYPARVESFTANVDPGSITLRFVNRGGIPATSVTFVVNNGGDNRSIVDKGSFRPGVLIEHAFDGYGGASDFSTATCAVAEVEFEDGTAWHVAPANFTGDAGLQAADAESDGAADTIDRRRVELEKLNAEVRRVAFRHLGTSL